MCENSRLKKLRLFQTIGKAHYQAHFVRNWPFEIIDLFQTAVFAHPRIFGPVAHMVLGEEPACVPQIIVMNCV